MEHHSTIIVLALLALLLAPACTASDVATPGTTTPTTAVATSQTSTPTLTPVLVYVVPLIPNIPKEAIQKQHSKHSICHPVPLPARGVNHRDPEFPDFSYYNVRGYWAHENYIRWSPDSSRILFDLPNEQNMQSAELYSVAADGSQLKQDRRHIRRRPRLAPGRLHDLL